jgi:serine/threonine protein phosphatase PrpC
VGDGVFISTAIAKGAATLQDRIEVFRFGDRATIALADGAGGRPDAAEAAEAFVRLVAESAAELHDLRECERLVASSDLVVRLRTKGGETTGIVAVIEAGRVFGASVGDSAAWLLTPSGARELTAAQESKPFLGTGAAMVRAFQCTERGTLVVATDGLWKYADLTKIRGLAAARPAEAKRFIELVRYPSGALPDDVAVAVVEST